jgi:HEAT repeat protein
VLERAAFGDYLDDGELRELLASDAPDELLTALAPALADFLPRAARCTASDARARRRLCLALDRTGAGGPAADAWLRERLRDPDRRVVRAAVYALAARGDRRALAPLIEVLKDAPLFRFIRSSPSGAAFEEVEVARALIRLAGEAPRGAPSSLDELEPAPYRVVEAWERWWREHRAQWPEQYAVDLGG